MATTSGPGRPALDDAFVGRSDEIAEGRSLVRSAVAGRGGALLVFGEAGIGKSRLADELAGQAAAAGMQVAWGRCWEAGGAPAYWPWVQSLRSLVRDLPPGRLAESLGAAAPDIGQLLPEMTTLVGPFDVPPALDPDAARFQLFDSVSGFLYRLAASQPLMLVFDDLQAADTPSVLLLQFLAAGLGDSRLAVVGTCRDTELGRGHALTSALTDLERQHAVRRVDLRGLAEQHVAGVIAAAIGSTPQPALVRAVHAETEGNPLFVHEVVRLLLDEGRLAGPPGALTAPLAVPRTVRDVIGRRLRPLSTHALHVLSLASVLGREFSVEALARLAGREDADIHDALDEARTAHIVSDAPAGGRLRFSHVLVRETLHDDIEPSRRIEFHRLAGEMIEDLYGADLDAHLAELAHHFFVAAPGGDLERAIDYACRAGDKAVALLAYEEAVRLYGMALQARHMSSPQNAERRCAILLSLGDAQGRAGDEAGSKASFLEASALAKRLALPRRLAEAAIGYGGRVPWKRAADDPHVIPLLQEGRAALGGVDSVLAARLLARLAGALRDDRSPEPRESLCRQAVAMARRLGDPATLAFTLEGMFGALWRPDNPEERLAIADEIIDVAGAAGDRERLLSGHSHRLMVFFELGDIAATEQEYVVNERLAVELRQPARTWFAVGLRVLFALFQGRFTDAEALMDEAYALGEHSYRSDAFGHNTMQLYQLRREQDRLAEVEERLRVAARELTWYPMFRCALALLYCELHRPAEARAELEALAADGFAAVPRDNEWLFGMTLLAEVACRLGETARASTLYDMLVPYAGRNAVGPAEGCTGSVDRTLGMLAAATSRLPQAQQHFERALEHNRRMGARPWVAHTQHEYARLLIARGDGGEQRAAEQLREALAACEQLGMMALHRAATRTLSQLDGRVAPATGPQGHVAHLRLEGEYWSIGYEGRMCRLRDSKGLRVLAVLLVNPGRPHAALDLERMGAPDEPGLARAAAAGDAGEMLDEEARRAYRARITELREQIVDAEAWGRADEAGAMREEVDLLARELSRAFGLGGQARRAGSAAERARLNVTRAVKTAMRRIAAADPELAAHLTATVRTGTVCTYSPDPRSAVAWANASTEVPSG